ncbi:MAG: hypothetical protein ACD_64C00173G0001 [uncultured bacterium]|nr:MAG: hypothetical protein ACD_64C00173G0001 [uncultured bacterium]
MFYFSIIMRNTLNHISSQTMKIITMKKILTCILTIISSAHSYTMNQPAHAAIDHSSCLQKTIAFPWQGLTFFKTIPRACIITHQGALYLCRHANTASILKECPEITRHVFCNGKEQFLLTKSYYGILILLLINDTPTASASHSEQGLQG